MLPGSVASSLRLVWTKVPTGVARRSVAWSLLRDLVPGAVLTNPCLHCGGDHGPVRVDGVEVEASVTYAGNYALVAVVARVEASALGIDAELAIDPHRDAVGLGGILGDGRPVDVRAWTRVEAALKADRRGLRVAPELVEVTDRGDEWNARVPGRSLEVVGRDLDGPPGVVVSAALIPAPAEGRVRRLER